MVQRNDDRFARIGSCEFLSEPVQLFLLQVSPGRHVAVNGDDRQRLQFERPLAVRKRLGVTTELELWIGSGNMRSAVAEVRHEPCQRGVAGERITSDCRERR